MGFLTAALAVGGALLGAKSARDSADAARDAGELQAQANREAIAETRRQFDVTQQNLAPFIEPGQELSRAVAAAGTLEGLPASGGVAGLPGARTYASDRPANAADVTQLYQEIFGRRPDSGGFRSALDSGLSPQELADIFRRSEEFQGLVRSGQAPELQAGPRQGGFADRIAAILESDALDPLIAERRRAVENQIAQGGLRRSGAGLEAAAAIPTEVAFALENQLFNRLAGTRQSGQNAAVQQADIGARASSDVATLQQGIGNALAGGKVGAADARALGTENLIRSAGTLGTAIEDIMRNRSQGG